MKEAQKQGLCIKEMQIKSHSGKDGSCGSVFSEPYSIKAAEHEACNEIEPLQRYAEHPQHKKCLRGFSR